MYGKITSESILAYKDFSSVLFFVSIILQCWITFTNEKHESESNKRKLLNAESFQYSRACMWNINYRSKQRQWANLILCPKWFIPFSKHFLFVLLHILLVLLFVEGKTSKKISKNIRTYDITLVQLFLFCKCHHPSKNGNFNYDFLNFFSIC